MTPPKARLYKKDYALELLKLAKADSEAGLTIKSARAGRAEILAFFSQQIVEKAIKGVLCWKEVPFPAVHDIRQLLDLLPAESIAPHAEDLPELTIYGTVRRYEEGPWSLSWDEGDISFDVARDVLAWAESCLT